MNSDNLMSFRNRGGFGGGGVCWWHSRFQRNALYLTYYSPTAKKPDLAEARSLLRNIRNGSGVMEIKGFANFKEFSTYFESEIQKELEAWQRFESLRGTFVRGLRGSAVVSSQFMKVLMDNLYEEVHVKNNIGYQKLQMKNVVAHAWLVINMYKHQDGYDLEVLDSNFPYQTSFYQYRYGDTHLEYENIGVFTPYLEFENEMERLKQTVRTTCFK